VDDLAGYVKHIHLNDNDGIQDLHLPVGEGKMDWKILNEKKLFACDPSVLIEVSGMERLNASYHNMREMRFI